MRIRMQECGSPPSWAEGFPIQQIYFCISNPSGDAEIDEQLKRQLGNAFGIRAGANFRLLFADQALSVLSQQVVQ